MSIPSPKDASDANPKLFTEVVNRISEQLKRSPRGLEFEIGVHPLQELGRDDRAEAERLINEAGWILHEERGERAPGQHYSNWQIIPKPTPRPRRKPSKPNLNGRPL